MNLLSFKVQDFTGVPEYVAHVDGVSLIDLICAFEESRGWIRPKGTYAGLIPAHYGFGELTRYFSGELEGAWPDRRIYLLGCDCGEVECWPLEAHVGVDDGRVTWSHFAHPHRPQWDYSAFGPFTFDTDQYRQAVRAAMREADLGWTVDFG